MGMSMASGGKSGSRRRGNRTHGAMAEINMTPFIDVMLVLLIIFMVAAPLLASGVAIDLPQTKAGPLNIDKKPLSVAINEQGEVFLNDNKIAVADLPTQLAQVATGGFDDRIYVRAGKDVLYGKVAEVMAIITSAGFKKVALVTDRDNGK